jgi:hypothetical protein
LVLFLLKYNCHLVPEGISPPKKGELSNWKNSAMLTFMHLRKGISKDEAVLAEVTVPAAKPNKKAIIFDHKDGADMFFRNIG